MSLLALLFVIFVVLQLGYLFGGQETIQATTGMTVAEYARRGFFELIAVAGLTLALLLVLGATSGGQSLFKILAGVLVVCVLIILASAAQRLDLYMDAYGLTLARVLAVACMAWLALNLLLFTITVLRERVAGFAAAMAVSGIAISLLLAVTNPAALVASTNIDRAIQYRQQNAASVPSPPASTSSVAGLMRMEGFGQIDLSYLLALGSDAVPAVLERLEDLYASEQCRVAIELLRKWHPDYVTAPERGWRSWNASHARARKAVIDVGPRLLEKDYVTERLEPNPLPGMTASC